MLAQKPSKNKLQRLELHPLPDLAIHCMSQLKRMHCGPGAARPCKLSGTHEAPIDVFVSPKWLLYFVFTNATARMECHGVPRRASCLLSVKELWGTLAYTEPNHSYHRQFLTISYRQLPNDWTTWIKLESTNLFFDLTALLCRAMRWKHEENTGLISIVKAPSSSSASLAYFFTLPTGLDLQLKTLSKQIDCIQ